MSVANQQYNKMNTLRTFLVTLLFLCAATAFGQIVLPKLVSDGAILQRDTPLQLWGWASPEEQIEVKFNNHTFNTRADKQGNWHIPLPPQPAGGPHSMVFQGNNRITLQNILFGDVWLCSGQSNMELTMQRVKDTYPDEIKNSANPNIRQFLVPDRHEFNKEHKDLAAGNWTEAGPETIYHFSAVAYFFAKELYDRYQVPIGLINAALGGSPVEAWMSEDALKPFPYAYEELQRFKDTSYIREIRESDENRQKEWYRTLNRNDAGLVRNAEWHLESVKDTSWQKMNIPGFWADEAPGKVNGVVWFRRQLNIPAKMTGKEATLWLGRIVDQDSVYVNGNFVGTTGYQYPPRKYTIAPGILKEGRNTFAIRVINQQGRGGFIPNKPYFLAVGKDTISLTGPWKYRLGTEAAPLAGPTFIRWKAGGLYKGMIAPLLNYRIKGVIWYQGESNTGAPEKYYETFPALIRDWRARWNSGTFPFLYVQLANFMQATDAPTESTWAELRQAQLHTLSLPNTGMAVTIDLGEWNDIHPLNKEDVGKRLALQAYKQAYGDKKTVASSPTPDTYTFHRKKVTIRFKDTGDGLVAKNGKPLAFFEISNDGKHFVKADARIKGKKVIVWNKEVDTPVAVRYAWANNPEKANLYSKNGLPASPFEIRKEKNRR